MTTLEIMLIVALVFVSGMLINKYRSKPVGQLGSLKVSGESTWFDKAQPLWLPPGTVRAIVVLGLTYAIIVILFKSIIMQQEIPSTVAQYIRELTPALVLIIKGYIDTRTEQQSKIGGTQ